MVGFSGGLDSTVLLHLLVGLWDKRRDKGELGASLDEAQPLNKVRAVHVNHQLSVVAEEFESHCRKICKAWEVPLTVVPVQVDGAGSAGPEGEARAARYRAFSENLQQDEVLLQAHHQDDQVETLLLRLLRGAGPRGLAAIPPRRRLGKGWVVRPLLSFSRAELRAYAEAAGLEWVEDPSNSDIGLDRNYCRHVILPAMAERWPAYRKSLHKTATLSREADGLLQDLAAIDLQAALAGEHDDPAAAHKSLAQESQESLAAKGLPLAYLRTLTPARQRNALRLFLHRLGLPDPGWNRLQQLVSNIIPATGRAEFHLGEHRLLVHRARLYLQPPPAEGV